MCCDTRCFKKQFFSAWAGCFEGVEWTGLSVHRQDDVSCIRCQCVFSLPSHFESAGQIYPVMCLCKGWTHTNAHKRTHPHTNTYKHTRAHTPAHKRAHIHTPLHTHAHTSTQTHSFPSLYRPCWSSWGRWLPMRRRTGWVCGTCPWSWLPTSSPTGARTPNRRRCRAQQGQPTSYGYSSHTRICSGPWVGYYIHTRVQTLPLHSSSKYRALIYWDCTFWNDWLINDI